MEELRFTYTTDDLVAAARRVCEDDAQYERLKRLGEKLAQPKTSEQE